MEESLLAWKECWIESGLGGVEMVGRLFSSLVHSNSFYQRMDEILFGCLTVSTDLSVQATEMDI